MQTSAVCSLICEFISSIFGVLPYCTNFSCILMSGIFLYYVYYKFCMCAKLSLYYNITDLTKFVIENTSELRTIYRPTPYLVNGNIQTFFSELYNRAINGKHGFVYNRELVKLEDGGQIALDWPLIEIKGNPCNTPIIVIFPGLTGGYKNCYVGHIIKSAAERGFKSVVLNKRGCADTPLLVFPHFTG